MLDDDEETPDTCNDCGSDRNLIEDEYGEVLCFVCWGYTCVVCEQQILAPGDMSLDYVENIHTECEPDDEDDEVALGLTPMETTL